MQQRFLGSTQKGSNLQNTDGAETTILLTPTEHTVCSTHTDGTGRLFSLERTQPIPVQKYTGKARRGFSLCIENVGAKYLRTKKSHTSPAFSIYHLGTLDMPTTQGAFSASPQTTDGLPQGCTWAAKARHGLSVCSTERDKLGPQKRDGEAFLSG